MTTYAEWFAQQPQERQLAAIEHTQVCVALGEAQRRDPHGEEAAALSRKVSEYYRKWSA